MKESADSNAVYRASYMRGILPSDAGYREALAKALRLWPRPVGVKR